MLVRLKPLSACDEEQWPSIVSDMYHLFGDLIEVFDEPQSGKDDAVYYQMVDAVWAIHEDWVED